MSLEETTSLYSDGDDELTLCCGASAKGCEGYIGCRACYAPITYTTFDWDEAYEIAANSKVRKRLWELWEIKYESR